MYCIIVNPNAGKGKGKKNLKTVLKLFSERGAEYSVFETTRAGEAKEFSERLTSSGEQEIIVVGGDGTLHEVVNGLFIQQEVCPSDVLLAVVAVGTGNDWVRTFGISNRYQDAAKAISEGYSFLQDVGVVSYEEAHYRQSRYMVNVAGAGYEAQVVRCFNHLKKSGTSRYPIAFQGRRDRQTYCFLCSTGIGNNKVGGKRIQSPLHTLHRCIK